YPRRFTVSEFLENDLEENHTQSLVSEVPSDAESVSEEPLGSDYSRHMMMNDWRGPDCLAAFVMVKPGLVEDAISSALYQRRVWGVQSPVLGLAFDPEGTTIQVIIGWLGKDPASNSDLLASDKSLALASSGANLSNIDDQSDLWREDQTQRDKPGRQAVSEGDRPTNESPPGVDITDEKSDKKSNKKLQPKYVYLCIVISVPRQLDNSYQKIYFNYIINVQIRRGIGGETPPGLQNFPVDDTLPKTGTKMDLLQVPTSEDDESKAVAEGWRAQVPHLKDYKAATTLALPRAWKDLTRWLDQLISAVERRKADPSRPIFSVSERMERVLSEKLSDILRFSSQAALKRSSQFAFQANEAEHRQAFDGIVGLILSDTSNVTPVVSMKHEKQLDRDILVATDVSYATSVRKLFNENLEIWGEGTTIPNFFGLDEVAKVQKLGPIILSPDAPTRSSIPESKVETSELERALGRIIGSLKPFDIMGALNFDSYETNEDVQSPPPSSQRETVLASSANIPAQLPPVADPQAPAPARVAMLRHEDQSQSQSKGAARSSSPPEASAADAKEVYEHLIRSLLLPLLACEFKKHKGKYEVTGPNQIRMYLTSLVKFLGVLGIYDFNVYGLLTEGTVGGIVCAWMTKPDKKAHSGIVHILERNCHGYDIANPLGAVNFAVFLLHLRFTQAPALKERFQAVKDSVRAKLDANDVSLNWTMEDQVAQYEKIAASMLTKK
ncbi:hypothetical protein OF83DRAFT_1087113, partial [Amylostereum chailletii]